jgi:hypothetical protein
VINNPYKDQLNNICEFLITESESVFKELQRKDTSELLFRFNFFMLIRLHDAFIGVSQLIKSNDFRPLFYSFANLIRPILMDAAYSNHLKEKIIEDINNGNNFFSAYTFINNVLRYESKLMRNFSRNFDIQGFEQWSKDLENYENSLSVDFEKKFPGKVLEDQKLSIDKIFANKSKESKKLKEIWHVYKIFSQMTHINDFFGELQKKDVSNKIETILTSALLSIDHFTETINNISLLPEYKTSLFETNKRIIKAGLELKLKINI